MIYLLFVLLIGITAGHLTHSFLLGLFVFCLGVLLGFTIPPGPRPRY